MATTTKRPPRMRKAAPAANTGTPKVEAPTTEEPRVEVVLRTKGAAIPTCKKVAAHGPHKVTTSGSYCVKCDRIVAEAENEARRAAKVAGTTDAEAIRLLVRAAAKAARASIG